jgi:TRAP-type C4-dicarboxylate transport system substrate-binding protein
MKRCRKTLFAFSAIIGALTAGTAANAVDLTFGSYYPPQHLVHEYGIKPANDELKGKIHFEIVAGGQLFSASTALKGIGTGVADAGSIVNSYTRSQLKHAVITTDLTFVSSHPLVSDGAAMETYFLDCPDCLADFKREGTIFIAGATSAGYSLMCRAEVKGLEDVKGKKIRTAGAMGRLAQAMGGTAVSMSTSDMVEALSRGQIDCIMGPLAWLKSYPISDIVTHVFNFDIGAFNSVAALLMNRATWDKLSPENKKALWQAAPGIDARATILGYLGEYLDAIELAKKHNIALAGPNAETRKLAKVHATTEVQAVIAASKKINTTNAEAIVAAYMKNLAKWEKIIHDAGLDRIAGSPDVTRDELKKAVPIYTELLRKYVYDKVDYNKL